MSQFMPQIKVTDEQYQAFLDAAAKAGFTPTDYMRHLLLGEPKPVYESEPPSKRRVIAPKLEDK